MMTAKPMGFQEVQGIIDYHDGIRAAKSKRVNLVYS